MSGDERVNKVEIDGIEWTFVVKDGFAVVGDGSSTAIPQTTSGKIAIPLALGGCPVTKIGEGFTPSNPPHPNCVVPVVSPPRWRLSQLVSPPRWRHPMRRSRGTRDPTVAANTVWHRPTYDRFTVLPLDPFSFQFCGENPFCPLRTV